MHYLLLKLKIVIVQFCHNLCAFANFVYFFCQWNNGPYNGTCLYLYLVKYSLPKTSPSPGSRNFGSNIHLWGAKATSRI